MRLAIGLVLSVLLAGGGVATAALAANTEQWEGERIAAEALAAAEAEFTDARGDALAERDRLAALTTEGATLLDAARTFLALAPGWADAALLTALTKAVDALDKEWATGLPPGVPVTDGASTVKENEEWTARLGALQAEAREIADRRAPLLQAAHDAVDALARAAVKAGIASISGMTLPSDTLKGDARGTLADLAKDMLSEADPLAALAKYSVAWKALHDAQVAAQAAAASAAVAGASTGGRSSTSPSGVCVMPPPGNYEIVVSDDGEWWTVPGYPCLTIRAPEGNLPVEEPDPYYGP